MIWVCTIHKHENWRCTFQAVSHTDSLISRHWSHTDSLRTAYVWMGCQTHTYVSNPLLEEHHFFFNTSFFPMRGRRSARKFFKKLKKAAWSFLPLSNLEIDGCRNEVSRYRSGISLSENFLVCFLSLFRKNDVGESWKGNINNLRANIVLVGTKEALQTSYVLNLVRFLCGSLKNDVGVNQDTNILKCLFSGREQDQQDRKTRARQKSAKRAREPARECRGRRGRYGWPTPRHPDTQEPALADVAGTWPTW